MTQIPGYIRKDSEKKPISLMMIFEGTYTSHHHSLHSRTWTLSIDHTKQLILRWGYPWVRGTTGSLEDDKHPRHSGGIEWSLLSQAILLVQVYIVQIQNPFRNRIGWDECWSDNDLVMCSLWSFIIKCSFSINPDWKASSNNCQINRLWTYPAEFSGSLVRTMNCLFIWDIFLVILIL